jgi:hypothetical protein
MLKPKDPPKVDALKKLNESPFNMTPQKGKKPCPPVRGKK